MPTHSPVRLIISDLHLRDAVPERTQALAELIAHFSDRLTELYILGDLFDYWIGDDYRTQTANAVALITQKLPYTGWIFGNRDFLLGSKGYFQDSGMHPLPEVHKLSMAGQTTLLCHGDHLCIKDTEHQRNRKIYTNPTYQQQLLQKSIDERLHMATNMRQTSFKRKTMLEEIIVDVDTQAVQNLMDNEQATLLIHGHTHRPSLHQHPGGQRMVLGEWTDHGWFICEDLTTLRLDLCFFSIPFNASSITTMATISPTQHA